MKNSMLNRGVSVFLIATMAACTDVRVETPSRKFGVGSELAVSPYDSSILRLGLVDGIDKRFVGEGGSVWRMKVSKKSESEPRIHWLVLYPDGRCLLSLRFEEWPERRASRNDQHKEAALRLREAIAAKGNEGLLRLAIASLEAQSCDYCHMPMLGRFYMTNDHLEINVFEIPPFAHGPSLFGQSYDSTGVSKFVFRRQGDSWVLNQVDSVPIWWTQDMSANRVFKVDHPALGSVRGADVTLSKISETPPPPLPKGWQW